VKFKRLKSTINPNAPMDSGVDISDEDPHYINESDEVPKIKKPKTRQQKEDGHFNYPIEHSISMDPTNYPFSTNPGSSHIMASELFEDTDSYVKVDDQVQLKRNPQDKTILTADDEEDVEDVEIPLEYPMNTSLLRPDMHPGVTYPSEFGYGTEPSNIHPWHPNQSFY